MDAGRYRVLRGLAVTWTERGEARPIDGTAHALDAGAALKEALDGYDEAVSRLKVQATALVDGQDDLRKREAQARSDVEAMDLARREALQQRDRAVDAVAAAEKSCREEHQAALDGHSEAMVQWKRADEAERELAALRRGMRALAVIVPEPLAQLIVVLVTKGDRDAVQALRSAIEGEPKKP